MATETPFKIIVPNIVRVSAPVHLHLRKDIGLKNSLDLGDRDLYGISSLRINIRVVLLIKIIKTAVDEFCGLVCRRVRGSAPRRPAV